MTGWLTQMGYPVVNVTRHLRNDNTIEYILNQEYFLLYQQKPTKAE
jgi:hypothetical protein